MAIRLIATDLDGTLLNTQQTISGYTAEILTRAAEAGYYVVPSTGRSLYALPPELARFPHDYLLINSGAVVLERKTCRNIYCAEISPDTMTRFFRIIESYDVACNLATADGPYMPRRQHEAFLADLEYTHRRDEFWLDFYRHRVKVFDDFDQWMSDTSPVILKINLYFRDEKGKSEIPPQLTVFSDLVICSSRSGDLEITDTRATKGLALLALAKHLELSPAEIIAFGDTDNDIDMLRTVGTGVAVANALPEVLSIADRITRSNDEDGVAWAVEQWVLSQPNEV